MRYQDALKEACRQLKTVGIEEAEADAFVLFEFCTGISRTYYFLKKTEKIREEEWKKLQNLIKRRADHVPVQHLTGIQYFCGLEFLVDEHVLIPRQDTECLVEEACRHIKNKDRILDLCTGSGCILLSLSALTGYELELVGSDISEQALLVAIENARRLKIEAEFFQGDLFEHVAGKFDCIVSNPPYIVTSEIADLSPEVREHEPLWALDGKEDGLFFYKEIIKEAGNYLKDGGWLLFEIGYDQGESVPLLMQEAGYIEIEVKKDLAGHSRVVSGRRPESFG